ncbi:MAG: 2-oxo acid dehydrogenase subunit E2 [Pseudonocardia sp.]|nr:2-oxo acid dehydrogenase subunit E2 [Pseudonocardia sp.]
MRRALDNRDNREDRAVGFRTALTLTCVHRVLDGVEAARFLARVRELLERPIALLLDREGHDS